MSHKNHTTEENLDWHNNLPSKRVSASALCWNNIGQLLFVLPSYDNYWTLPGGVVESGESPLVAAARELQEETGVIVDPKDLRFAGVNYAHPYKQWNDFIHFYFDAGVLNDKQIKKIGEMSEKLHGCQFLHKAQLETYVAPYRLEVLQSLYNPHDSHPYYLETRVK